MERLDWPSTEDADGWDDHWAQVMDLATELFRADRARMIAEGILDAEGHLLRDLDAADAVTTDTDRW